MCQAFEAERRAIVREEKQATREGYAAAKAGKPKNNPYPAWDSYCHRAWLHGYDCLAAGIIPWAVEKIAKEALGE